MALNLQRILAASSAESLVVYDAQPSSPGVAAAVLGGAHLARSAKEVAELCSEIVLCLPDGSAVHEVLFGGGVHSEGLASRLSKGALVIDCSTTEPEVSRNASTLLRRLRCRFIDAPVTGERTRAETGALTAMVGGPADDADRAAAVLSAFSSDVVRVGEAPGSGQLAKALNNALYNVSVAAMAEVLPLACRAGLDPGAFIRVVAGGTGQSFGFSKFAPLVLERCFEAPAHGYPMGKAFKDMETAAASAVAAGVELRVVGAAALTYREALTGLDLGHEHKGAMVKVWERELGVIAKAGKPLA